MSHQASRSARALTIWLAALVLVATTLPAAAASTKINRDIIALYDSATEPQPHSTTLHQVVEMPLNHLGLRVTYVDLREPLPDLITATGYRAVLLWLKSGAKPPPAALEWIANVADAGVRIVIMGELTELAAGNDALFNRLLGRLGLHYEGYEIEATYRTRVAQLDEVVSQAERRLDPPLPGFSVISLEPGRSTPHLTVVHPKGAGLAESVLVATSAAGGFIANNYAISYDVRADRLQWLIEPFAFFRRALLGNEYFPIPDVTTISGRRLYFSHIDGDGWNNTSSVEQYHEQRLPSAQVVLRELIAPYPGLPVTVGLVAADADPDHGGQLSAKPIARDIFALPQVEVGSHTYTHPYRWDFFEAYDRALEQRLVQEATRPKNERPADLTTKAEPQAPPEPTAAMPRSYSRQPFDLGLEVEGALRAAEALAPPGKRAKLYQWSGDTRPFEAAVRMTRQAGVRNINGGDARLDSLYPSLTYLPPISRTVGKERQIYAVNSNEYVYVGETGRDHAFLLLAETLRNTEQPVRLRGFNLYYHMYAAERSASLNAVRHFLELADKGAYVPISASHYAAIADSFFPTELWLDGPDRWSIHGRHDIETVRFDRAAGKSVDLPVSAGVLGMKRHGDALYVALDPAVERPIVALRDRDDDDRTADQTGRPYLSESRWRLSHLALAPCRIAFTASGFGPGQMSWRGLPAGHYRVEARRGSASVWSLAAQVDATGVLDFTIEAAGLEPLAVDISCDAAGSK
jgi:hypothetical protein